jgi:hypothetical protein
VATEDNIAGITRALNRVSTAGQARQAIGLTTEALHRTYKVADMLPTDRRSIARRTLDKRREPLERWYRDIEQVSAAAPFKNDFVAKRSLILGTYVDISGIEGEAHYKPVTSNVDILLTSIQEAPAVFGKAVGAVAKEAGKTAGTLAGGIFSGLGISGTIGLVVVLAVIALVVTRGTIIGRLLGGRVFG